MFRNSLIAILLLASTASFAQDASQGIPHLKWASHCIDNIISVSHDGKYILTYVGLTLRVYDAKLITSIGKPFYRSGVYAFCFTSHDSTILLCSKDKINSKDTTNSAVYEWNWRTNVVKKRFAFWHYGRDMAFSADGTELIERINGKDLAIYNAMSGATLFHEGHFPEKRLRSLRFDDDRVEIYRKPGIFTNEEGRYVVCEGEQANSIYIYDLRTYSLADSVFFGQQLFDIESSVVLDDNNEVIVKQWNGPIYAYDIQKRRLDSIAATTGLRSMAYLGQQRIAFVDGKNGSPHHNNTDSLAMLDLSTKKRRALCSLPENASIAAIAGTKCFISIGDKIRECIDINTLTCDTLIAFNGPITKIFPFRSSANLAIVFDNSLYTLFDLNSKTLSGKQTMHALSALRRFSPNGKYLCDVKPEGVFVSDFPSDSLRYSKQGPGYRKANVAFSPDSKYLYVFKALRSNADSIEQFDAASGMHISTKTLDSGSKVSFFSNMNSLYCLSNRNTTSTLTNVSTGKQVQQYFAPNNDLTLLAITADGKWVIAKDMYDCLQVYSTSDQFIHGDYAIRYGGGFLTLTPNERFLIAASDYGAKQDSLTVIDLSACSLSKVCIDTDRGIIAFAFSSDGSEMYAGFDDGSFRIYDVPKQWVEQPKQPLRIKKTEVPVGIFVSYYAKEALENGKPFNPPRTDGRFEILDADHHPVATLFEGTRHMGKWHTFFWDATDKPKGKYYKRITIGGVVSEEPFELK